MLKIGENTRSDCTIVTAALRDRDARLLDDAAAQIRIDQAAFGAPDRFAKPGIRNPLAAREARKSFCLEYSQFKPPPYYEL
jgi:hypothetical protein